MNQQPDVYSLILLEWANGMWDYELKKGAVKGAAFTGSYLECLEYHETWKY